MVPSPYFFYKMLHRQDKLYCSSIMSAKRGDPFWPYRTEIAPHTVRLRHAERHRFVASHRRRQCDAGPKSIPFLE